MATPPDSPREGMHLVETILKEISDIVTSLDDSQHVLDSLVRLVTRLLKVDRCSLMLIDPVAHELRMRAAHGIKPEVIESYRARLGEGIAGWVALHGRPLLIQDIANHPLFRRGSSSQYNTRSLLSVPLVFREKVIGVLNVNNKLDNQIFSESDELLLSTVANFIVIALEKAKLREVEEEKNRIDADLRLAEEIQRAFLPRAFPTNRDLKFAAYCKSAFKVAGDFYDIIPLRNEKTCLVLGDVCGKGIAAALYMARVMSYFRAVASLQESTQDLLPSVNRFLAGEWSDRTFATASLLVMDRGQGEVSIYSAGHPSPYLFRESSETLHLIEVSHGFPLGVDADCQYDRVDVALASGDSIIVYTDGITDAANARGEHFGQSRFEEAIRAHRGPPEKLVERISKTVLDFEGGRSQDDDQTLVVVRKV